MTDYHRLKELAWRVIATFDPVNEYRPRVGDVRFCPFCAAWARETAENRHHRTAGLTHDENCPVAMARRVVDEVREEATVDA